MKKTHRATGLEPNIRDGAPQLKQDPKEHDRTEEHRPQRQAGAVQGTQQAQVHTLK